MKNKANQVQSATIRNRLLNVEERISENEEKSRKRRHDIFLAIETI